MRSWFTLVATCLIVLLLIFFAFVAMFVLENREMFETTFTIVMPFPYYVWENVKFVYIIIGNFLLGLSVALIISFISLLLDTKRALKQKNMKKELKRLQQALQEAQALHKAAAKEEPETVSQIEEESPEMAVAPPASPEEISKSFDDTIEKGDFLDTSKKRREDESGKGFDSEETDIRERVTGTGDVGPVAEQEAEAEEEAESEAGAEPETETEEEPLEETSSEHDKDFLGDTSVEAELVEEEEDQESRPNEPRRNR